MKEEERPAQRLYHGKRIEVHFDKSRCNHVAECLRRLPNVFDLTRRPWILPDAADVDELARTIEACPTGALHYRRLDGGPQEAAPDRNTLRIMPHGPAYLHGELIIVDGEGHELFRDTRMGVCRCGKSAHPPHCDGRHLYEGFRNRPEKQHDAESLQQTPPAGPLRVTVRPGGSVRVEGAVEIQDRSGEALARRDRVSICACGRTKASPWCDGSHRDTAPEE